MLWTLVALITLSTTIFVIVGIIKKVFNFFAILSPLIVLLAGYLIAIS